MQLYQKQKYFSESYIGFFKCSSNFEHFQKRDDSHMSDISEITDLEQNG